MVIKYEPEGAENDRPNTDPKKNYSLHEIAHATETVRRLAESGAIGTLKDNLGEAWVVASENAAEQLEELNISTNRPSVTWKILHAQQRDLSAYPYLVSMRATNGSTNNLFHALDAADPESYYFKLLSCELEKSSKPTQQTLN